MDSTRILVYGTAHCSDCHAARRVLNEQGVGYDFVDIDEVPGAADEVLKLNHGMRSVPTIIFPNGTVMVEPSRRELLAAL
ncbi:MAG: glutaredoxin family protein [Candidatus Dormibacteria bacterium]|uniref:NrdH-redoxin n=1 Tax=Candidatus Aeolococcus gillhamiae TaxID=3127015 RepID=A0A2W5Z5U9_9BACT|nr:MAG: NrdH-redoxin [Candidatus Dormibacter sp. RRmetagenome_bin12]